MITEWNVVAAIYFV